jgi:predicted RecB family endonuclease
VGRQPRGVDLGAELARRLGLEVVRLINDQVLVGGQHAAVGAEVGEEQRRG